MLSGGALVWVALSVAAARRIAAVFPDNGRAAQVTIAAAAFAFICALGLNSRQAGRASAGLGVGGFRRATVASVLVYAAALLLMWPKGGSIALDRLASTLVAASAEEIVFRWLLPVALFTQARVVLGRRAGAWVLAVVVSQAAFAVAHAGEAVPSLSNGVPPGALRLFAAGLLLAAVASHLGIPTAIGVHAALNVDLGVIRTHAWSASPTVLVVVAGLSAVGLAYWCKQGPVPLRGRWTSETPYPDEGE